MIPALDSRGLLPPGVHVATFYEVEEAFGSTHHRRCLLSDLVKWAEDNLRDAEDAVDALIVGGSFLSSKLVPNDLDCKVLLDDSAAGKMLNVRLSSSRLLLGHYAARRIDVQPGGGSLFQFIDYKEASSRLWRASDLRGVVSIAEWHRETDRVQDLRRLAQLAA